ncbi:MFS transporter [Vibrio sp. S11_S32]|uniref:MFS transporter n=1 Tax=Vibrio sp. S11_S32 TaxID=2720225 RepID=UPI001680809F|nr:MFS transporter [Vibrio sp. S11_S32]MBD1577417.1 MFS transporter [Vibrio sp. S11_S32]
MHKGLRITIIAAIGMFLSMLDTGIIGIAVNDIAESFDSNTSIGALTVTSYSLMLCGTILIFGKLSSIHGTIKLFNFGMLLFLISSLLCSLSWSIWGLISFRALQGVAAAMIQSTAMTLIAQYIKNDTSRTKSIATVITFASMGPILAPVAGGMILNYLSWEWLFYINIPFCVVSLMLSSSVKIEKSVALSQSYYQIFLYSLSIVSLISGMMLSIEKVALPMVILAFILLIRSELSDKNNGVLLNKHVVSNEFYVSVIGSLFLGCSTSFMFIVSPLRLMASNDILFISVLSMILPVFTVFTSKISSIFITKIGYKNICFIGAFLMLIGVIGLSRNNYTVTYAIISLSSFGIGCGLFQPSNTVMLFKATDRSYHGMANSLSRLFVNMGIAVGSSLIAMYYVSN